MYILALFFKVSMVPIRHSKLLVIQYPVIHNYEYYAVSKILKENWPLLYSYFKDKVLLCTCSHITWYFSQMLVVAMPVFLLHGGTITVEARWILNCNTVIQNISSIQPTCHLGRLYSRMNAVLASFWVPGRVALM